jgi:hypothetical protein
VHQQKIANKQFAESSDPLRRKLRNYMKAKIIIIITNIFRLFYYPLYKICRHALRCDTPCTVQFEVTSTFGETYTWIIGHVAIQHFYTQNDYNNVSQPAISICGPRSLGGSKAENCQLYHTQWHFRVFVICIL